MANSPATAETASAERRAAARPTLAVTAVIVSAAIPPFLVGALTPLIGRDLTFGATEVGLSVAGYYLVSGVLSPVGGRIVGRLGVLRAMRLACVLTTVGLLAIASATAAIHIIVALALLGLPNSLVQPSANAVLATVRTPRLKAFVFGVVQASIPTATLIAGLVLGVASYVGGWRGTVTAVAVLTVIALYLTRILPDTDRPEQRTADGAARHRPRTTDGRSVLVALVAIGFLASAAATALPAFIASTGVAAGLSPGVVATTQSIGSLVCAATRITAPLVVPQGSALRQLAAIGGLLLLGTAGFLCLGAGTAIGFLIGTAAAYACGWGWNGLFNLVVVAVRPDGVAAATGITQGGVFLGGMAGPLTFSAVVAHNGYDAAWLVAALWAVGATVAAGVGVVLYRHTHPSVRYAS